LLAGWSRSRQSKHDLTAVECGDGQASERQEHVTFQLFSDVAVGTIGEQSMATSELPLGPASLQLADRNNDGEKSSGNLGDLLDQVSKNSVGEVDGLIGELRQLRAKLQADGDRIKREIQRYEALSQQVMQLTKIISDSVATLSNVQKPATNGSALPAIGWRKAD
jgi:hypothetical protein